MPNWKNGEVDWFDDQKGYGFIVSDGVRYFVHHTAIVTDRFKTLHSGQRVRFDSQTSPKGPLATSVTLTSRR